MLSRISMREVVIMRESALIDIPVSFNLAFNALNSSSDIIGLPLLYACNMRRRLYTYERLCIVDKVR